MTSLCIFALTTQQALPKSAIFTSSLSALAGSRGFTSRFPIAPDKYIVGEMRNEDRKKAKGIKKGTQTLKKKTENSRTPRTAVIHHCKSDS